MDRMNGIMIVGFAHTQLFDGTGGTELILLDLATGQDHTFPITEEQLNNLLSLKGLEIRDGGEEGQGPDMVEGHQDPARDPEEVPQF